MLRYLKATMLPESYGNKLKVRNNLKTAYKVTEDPDNKLRVLFFIFFKKLHTINHRGDYNMRRFMYYFIIILSIIVVSFIIREIIQKRSAEFVDTKITVNVCSKQISSTLKETSAQSDKTDKYNGLSGDIVIINEEQFDHRMFYVSSYDGIVAVFNKYGSLCRLSDVVTEGTPTPVRNQLYKKIYFKNITEAYNFIDDL